MAPEPFTHHIESIFQALDVGLDGLTEAPGSSFASVDYTPPKTEDIDPQKFNRGTVTIDGHVYTVSVFAATAPAVEEPECPTSTHGKHTFSKGRCIGCGEKQQ
jgi:hypothetical protein